MHALALHLKEARHRILGEPVNLQLRAQMSQFSRDGKIASRMPEPDG
jgi:hypothetical protein